MSIVPVNIVAQKKVALVIGNGNYSYENLDDIRFSSLSTSLNDADRMDSELRSLGYETLVVKDATRDDMIKACEEFERLCTNSNIAIFYYSGHAVTIEDRYYLVPCKTKLASGSLLGSKCLEVRYVSNLLKEKSQRSILFLDACRDEFAKYNVYSDDVNGVNKSEYDDKHEQMTFYATAKGQKATSGNGPLSPFTEVLANHIHDNEEFKTIWNNCIIPEVASHTNNKQTPEIGTETFSSPFYLNNSDNLNISDMVKLGKVYYYGIGEDINYNKAVDIFNKAAVANNAEAQNMLGVCYENGNGVKQDFGEAFKWYLKSADQGYDVAQCNIGSLYHEGIGVAQDDVEAVKWLRKAADQGNANAQNLLGLCYEKGEGVEQNYADAVNWYQKAADKEYAMAQYNLGNCYFRGIGVAQDYTESVKWLRKAAEHGNLGAQTALGVCYESGNGVPQDYTEAIKWYRKAADKGYAMAQNNLGYCYSNGIGVMKNVTVAYVWIKKAAEQGLPVAQYNLSYLYSNGIGVEKNIIEAIMWCRKAAENGNQDAIITLRNLGIW
jgi:hypothetical protein